MTGASDVSKEGVGIDKVSDNLPGHRLTNGLLHDCFVSGCLHNSEKLPDSIKAVLPKDIDVIYSHQLVSQLENSAVLRFFFKHSLGYANKHADRIIGLLGLDQDNSEDAIKQKHKIRSELISIALIAYSVVCYAAHSRYTFMTISQTIASMAAQGIIESVVDFDTILRWPSSTMMSYLFSMVRARKFVDSKSSIIIASAVRQIEQEGKAQNAFVRDFIQKRDLAWQKIQGTGLRQKDPQLKGAMTPALVEYLNSKMFGWLHRLCFGVMYRKVSNLCKNIDGYSADSGSANHNKFTDELRMMAYGKLAAVYHSKFVVNNIRSMRLRLFKSLFLALAVHVFCALALGGAMQLGSLFGALFVFNFVVTTAVSIWRGYCAAIDNVREDVTTYCLDAIKDKTITLPAEKIERRNEMTAIVKKKLPEFAKNVNVDNLPSNILYALTRSPIAFAYRLIVRGLCYWANFSWQKRVVPKIGEDHPQYARIKSDFYGWAVVDYLVSEVLYSLGDDFIDTIAVTGACVGISVVAFTGVISVPALSVSAVAAVSLACAHVLDLTFSAANHWFAFRLQSNMSADYVLHELSKQERGDVALVQKPDVQQDTKQTDKKVGFVIEEAVSQLLESKVSALLGDDCAMVGVAGR